MAISHPRLPPIESIQEMELFLDWESAGYTNRDRGGGYEYFEDAPVLWNVFIQPVPLDRWEWHDFRSWLDAMEGGKYGFLAYDFHRSRPRNYETSYPGAFAGTGSVASTTPTTITINGTPATLALKRGTLISLQQGGRYALHELTEDKTSTGTALALPVVPQVLTTFFTGAATYSFNKPSAQFAVDWGSVRRPERPGYNSLSFRGVQRIK